MKFAKIPTRSGDHYYLNPEYVAALNAIQMRKFDDETREWIWVEGTLITKADGSEVEVFEDIEVMRALLEREQ